MIRSITILFWFISNVFLKLYSKISFILGLLALFFSFLFNLIDKIGIGLRASTYAYGFFVVGIIIYLKEIYRNERSKK